MSPEQKKELDARLRLGDEQWVWNPYINAGTSGQSVIIARQTTIHRNVRPLQAACGYTTSWYAQLPFKALREDRVKLKVCKRCFGD